MSNIVPLSEVSPGVTVYIPATDYNDRMQCTVFRQSPVTADLPQYYAEGITKPGTWLITEYTLASAVAMTYCVGDNTFKDEKLYYSYYGSAVDSKLIQLYENNFAKTQWGKLINFTKIPSMHFSPSVLTGSSTSYITNSLMRYLFPLSAIEMTSVRTSGVSLYETGTSTKDGDYAINEMGDITPAVTVSTRTPYNAYTSKSFDHPTLEDMTAEKTYYSGHIKIVGGTGALRGSSTVYSSSWAVSPLNGATAKIIMLAFVLSDKALIDLDTMEIQAPDTVSLNEYPLGGVVDIGGTQYRKVDASNTNYNGTVFIANEGIVTTKATSKTSAYSTYLDTYMVTDYAPSILNSLPTLLQAQLQETAIPYSTSTSQSYSSTSNRGTVNQKIFFPDPSDFGFEYINNAKNVTSNIDALDFFSQDASTYVNYQTEFESSSKIYSYSNIPCPLFKNFFKSDLTGNFWTRAPGSAKAYWNAMTINGDSAAYTDTSNSYSKSKTAYFFPMFVVNPESIQVDITTEIATLIYNQPPTIAFLPPEDNDLPPSFSYSVEDVEGDAITVSEYFMDTLLSTFSAVSGDSFTYPQVGTATFFDTWQAKANDATYPSDIKIVVADENSSYSQSIPYTKEVKDVTCTLSDNLTVEGDITLGLLAITGVIPDDATKNYQVTNDGGTTWQDVKDEVENSKNILFDTIGSSFNFKINLARGSSDTAGYLTGVVGAFQ